MDDNQALDYIYSRFLFNTGGYFLYGRLFADPVGEEELLLTMGLNPTLPTSIDGWRMFNPVSGIDWHLFDPMGTNGWHAFEPIKAIEARLASHFTFDPTRPDYSLWGNDQVQILINNNDDNVLADDGPSSSLPSLGGLIATTGNVEEEEKSRDDEQKEERKSSQDHEAVDEDDFEIILILDQTND